MTAVINLAPASQATDVELTVAIEAHRTGGVHTLAQRPLIGSAADEAVAGNDPRMTNQRVPTDASVTIAKLATDTVTQIAAGDAVGRVSLALAFGL